MGLDRLVQGVVRRMANCADGPAVKWQTHERFDLVRCACLARRQVRFWALLFSHPASSLFALSSLGYDALSSSTPCYPRRGMRRVESQFVALGTAIRGNWRIKAPGGASCETAPKALQAVVSTVAWNPPE